VKRIVKDDGKIFSSNDISIIGSYSSFLALLLVATVFAVRGIFDELIKLYAAGTPFDTVEVLLIIAIVVFGLVFILIPAIPISITVRRAFKEGNKWLAWIIIFITSAYAFAVCFQVFYTLINSVIG
jgi:uncharacterized membrane protein YhaH (DUF805 family)